MIDLDDSRRQELDHEDEFDLVVLALHSHDMRQALAYADKISLRLPQLTILIVTDIGVFLPAGTHGNSIASGDPAALMEKIGSIMGSSELKVLSSRGSSAVQVPRIEPCVS